eukprot:gnl/MRDRNA2_/MRDRNA2_102252_c0_seq1.p1 gnl/MRDRNA2_/MRDRNA2_102252_c0~~gnl/MRDRNA2_/MRDRNA2_102252_c0_seq1.p1  ORF type:complete len:321 (-),score=62.07 gnl/MRDRNA2_/MRDRNA2_102252_c0_seq1:5-967(-)
MGEELDDDEEQKPEPHQLARRYQFRNLKDLHFDSFNESPEHDVEQPSVLPYFVQNGRFRATAVLEESVIDTECIKQSAFLRQFDPEFVEEMLSCEGCVRAIVFLPKQVIVREGEQGDSMMVIAKGEVEVSVHGVPVKRLGEGSFFGELVFVGATDVRTATITAVTFCDVRLIYRRAFTEVISKYPLVQQAFNDLVSQRIEAVQKDLLKHLRLAVKRASQVGSGRSPRTMGNMRQSFNPNSSRCMTAPNRPSGQPSLTNVPPSGGPQRGQQLALPAPGTNSVDPSWGYDSGRKYNTKAVEDPPWMRRTSGLSSVGQAVLKR